MSDDLIFSVLLLIVAVVIFGISARLALSQKLYFNPADNSVATEVEIPLLGKIKTNAPAIALCFAGLLPVMLAANAMKDRNPRLVRFSGDVLIDPAITDVSMVTVGITSSLWSNNTSPNGASLKVNIDVPDSWPSYSAYAFAFGGTKTKPVIIGADRNDPKFSLRIAP